MIAIFLLMLRLLKSKQVVLMLCVMLLSSAVSEYSSRLHLFHNEKVLVRHLTLSAIFIACLRTSTPKKDKKYAM